MRRRQIDVIRRRQVIVIGRTQETVAVGHHFQHAFALDDAIEFKIRIAYIAGFLLLEVAVVAVGIPVLMLILVVIAIAVARLTVVCVLRVLILVRVVGFGTIYTTTVLVLVFVFLLPLLCWFISGFGYRRFSNGFPYGLWLLALYRRLLPVETIFLELATLVLVAVRALVPLVTRVLPSWFNRRFRRIGKQIFLFGQARTIGFLRRTSNAGAFRFFFC